MLTLLDSGAPALDRPPRIGLAVAGGGPLGAIYELGALRALDEAIPGLRLHRLDSYVGVSAGAVIAASLANGLRTNELCAIFLNRAEAEVHFEPRNFMGLAWKELGRRAEHLPAAAYRALRAVWRRESSLAELSGLVPVGLFDNQPIQRFLHQAFTRHDRSDDFRKLAARLVVVAVDLDSGRTARFGAPGLEHVPISMAVQASTALPGLYPPVEIEGRHYVDGALRRTLHASVLLDDGVDLVLGIYPLVPYTADEDVPEQRLSGGGLPQVLSQTFRALIQSRMQVGMEKYAAHFGDASLLLVEPDRNDAEFFFTNIFSFQSRVRLCAHAYRTTRASLLARADEVDALLDSYGFALDRGVLEDPNRRLTESLDHGRLRAPLSRSLAETLDDLEINLGA